MKLYEKSKYDANINFLISTYIREYDISKANINILYKYNCINKSQYDYFYHADRTERQIRIGLILRQHPEYNKILDEGLTEARRLLFESNNLQPSDILSIKKDAIFIINKIPKFTKFDNIEFVCKNVYTSFYRLYNLELYYFFDLMSSYEQLDVKGISDENLIKHDSYFLEFLKVCFNSAQLSSIKETLDIVITFYNKYINKELDVEYYRQFNADSMYLIQPMSSYNVYKSYDVNEDNKNFIDIKYNLNLIRELYQIYSTIHLKTI